MDATWETTLSTFEEAATAFQALVVRVRPEAWSAAALGEWTVRDLVGHTSRAFTTVESYLRQPAESIDVRDSADYFLTALAADKRGIADRGREAGKALGDHPASATTGLVERALITARNVHPDAVITTPAGGMKVREYLPTRTFELTVHSLDLGTALDLADVAIPSSALEASLALVSTLAVRTGKSDVLLRGATGRRGLPAGFSVLQS